MLMSMASFKLTPSNIESSTCMLTAGGWALSARETLGAGGDGSRTVHRVTRACGGWVLCKVRRTTSSVTCRVDGTQDVDDAATRNRGRTEEIRRRSVSEAICDRGADAMNTSYGGACANTKPLRQTATTTSDNQRRRAAAANRRSSSQ